MPEFIIGVLGIAFGMLGLNLLFGKKRAPKQPSFHFPQPPQEPPAEGERQEQHVAVR